MTCEFRVRRKNRSGGGIVLEGREDAKTLKLVYEVLCQLRDVSLCSRIPSIAQCLRIRAVPSSS